MKWNFSKKTSVLTNFFDIKPEEFIKQIPPNTRCFLPERCNKQFFTSFLDLHLLKVFPHLKTSVSAEIIIKLLYFIFFNTDFAF